MKSKRMIFIFVCYLQLLSCSDTRSNSNFSSDDTLTNHENTITRLTNHILLRDPQKALDCSQLNTCIYNAKKYIPNCYCDEVCSTYDDCCFDAPLVEKNDKRFTHLQEIKNRSNCYPFNTDSRFDGILAVDTCMTNSSEQNNSCEQAKVSTLTDLVLVTGDDGITYKNEHCARCNGITYFKRWTVGVTLDFYYCKLPPGINLREEKHELDGKLAYQFYEEQCSFRQIPIDDHQPRYCLRTGFFSSNYDLSGGKFSLVTCNEKREPIHNTLDAFGSIPCCIKKSPYPEGCLTDFVCYESNDKQYLAFNNNSKEIGTNSMMVFFNFKSSNVSKIFLNCLLVRKKSLSKNKII